MENKINAKFLNFENRNIAFTKLQPMKPPQENKEGLANMVLKL